MTTMNLIQMQQALQTLPMQNVMQYANGSDPTVPAYLALTELNRRKQIQDTAAASQQVPQQTVKQSVESALTSPKTDMTQAPQQTDMTQAPQQTDLTQAPTGQINPAAPVNPAASQFKHGGLTALPINMFKEKNFAHGGIVAFDDGGFTSTRQQALDALNQAMPDKFQQGNQPMSAYLSNPENAQYLSDRTTAYNAIINNTLNPMSPDAVKAYQATYHRAPSDVEIMQPIASQNTSNSTSSTPQQWTSGDANNSEDMAMVPPNAGIASINPNTTAKPNTQAKPNIQVNPNTQLSNTPSGTIPPAGLQQMIQQAQNKVSDLYSTPSYLQQQPVQSLAEIQANQREAERLAGVSEDPLKATRERYQAIEAKQKEGASGDALDRLIAQASAFATADPTKGFGYAAGISATASQALKKEQNALREQQSMTMAKLYSEFDKEDEARKRGDSKGMLEAQQKIKENNNKLAEIETMRMQAQAGQGNALTNATQSAIQQYNAGFKGDETEALKKQAEAAGIHARASMISANKPTGAIDYDRYATNPAYAKAVDAVKTLGNVSKTDAQIRAEFQKSFTLQDEWRDKGGEEAYMAEQRRILGPGTGNPSTASGTDSQGNPTVRGKDGKSYPQTIVKDNVTLHYDAESGGYRR